MLFFSFHLESFRGWGLCSIKLKQLERLHSEDTPRRHMITNTTDSYWIQSQNKSKITICKNVLKVPILNCKYKTPQATRRLKLFHGMCKYEMNPVSIVENTKLTPFCPKTARQTLWDQYTHMHFCWSGEYNKTLWVIYSSIYAWWPGFFQTWYHMLLIGASVIYASCGYLPLWDSNFNSFCKNENQQKWTKNQFWRGAMHNPRHILSMFS